MKGITSVELIFKPEVVTCNIAKLEKEKGHENISQSPPLLQCHVIVYLVLLVCFDCFLQQTLRQELL